MPDTPPGFIPYPTGPAPVLPGAAPVMQGLNQAQGKTGQAVDYTQDPNAPLPGIPPEYANMQPGQFMPDPNAAGYAPADFALQHALANPVPAAPVPGMAPQVPVPVPAGVGASGQVLPPAPVQPAPVRANAPKHRPGSGGQSDLVKTMDADIAASEAAQAAALQGVGQAQQQAGEDEAQARRDMAVQRQANAAELAAKAAENAQHNRELDAIDAENLRAAKDRTIPDFWQGREGARVGSSIAVALAGIGAGLLGQTNNVALTAVQHNIDQYFSREKEKTDNLFKYAEQQGKFNQNTRMQYAQELLNLKDQHSYVIDAAADRVMAVAAQARGSVDMAKAGAMAAALKQQSFQDRKDARELRSRIMLQSAQAEQARAAAAEHKARAAQGGYFTPQQQIQMLKFAEAQFAPFRKEAIGQGAQPGPVAKLAAVEKVKQEWKEAYESGDPNRIAAVKTEIIEKVGPLLAGGRTTANLTKMIKDMNTLGGEIQANAAKMTGGNPVGKDYYQRMYNLLDSSAVQAKDMAGEIHQRAVSTFEGPGGHARNPELKNQFESDLSGVFGTATYNGQPLFQTRTGQEPASPAPAAAPPGLQPMPTQATTKPATMTVNGRTYYLQPNGNYK